jgi:hypothetical protein
VSTRWAAQAAAGLLASAILLLAATTAPAGAHAGRLPSDSPAAPLLWLMKSNDLALLQHQAATDGVTLPKFTTWVGCGGRSDPKHCRSGQQPIYTSYWPLRRTALSGWHGTTVFDIETWRATPAMQRHDPLKWICRAARLQKTDPHLKVIITPYVKPPTKKMIPEDVEAAKCGAYAVDLQTQFANGSPRDFGRFIRQAVRAVRKVNKKIIILAGLATNNPQVQVASNLATDYHNAQRAGVQGFWLNAKNWQGRNQCADAQGGPGCPQTGIQFLEDIGLIGGT